MDLEDIAKKLIDDGVDEKIVEAGKEIVLLLQEATDDPAEQMRLIDEAQAWLDANKQYLSAREVQRRRRAIKSCDE